MRSALKPLLVIWIASSVYFLWLIDFRLTISTPDNFYGAQTDAFLAGQLPLKVKPNPILASLPNPYLGEQNQPYRVQDLSYYKGRYYSYFGVGPILYLLLPWRVLTGVFLRDIAATTLLAIATNFAALLLLLRLGRLERAPAWGTQAVAYLLLCLGTWHSIHLMEINAGTIAQEGAYLWLTLAFLAALAVLERATVGRVASLSVACGLVLASRPSFLPCVVLLAPVFLDRRLRRPGLWMAAALPLGAIVGGLLLYNHARFDSYMEFGNRLQLVDRDYRTVPLLTVQNLGSHWRMFLFALPEPVHFFPFFNLDASAGLFLACPAFLLALGGVCLLRDDANRVVAQFFALVAASFVGIFVFLGAYKFYLFHYSVDFFVPAMWLAVLGWFALLAALGARQGWQRGVRVAGGILIGATIAFAFLYTVGRSPVEPLRRFADGMVARLDGLRGVAYGEVTVSGRLEHGEVGKSYPLLSAGTAGADVCYLRLLPGQRAQVGILQVGMGPISEPFAFDPLGSHDFQIAMGGLIPPVPHPFYQGWSDAEIQQAIHFLKVRVDGVTRILGHGISTGSAGGKLTVGADAGHHGTIEAAFPGHLTAARASFERGEWTGESFPPISGGGLRMTFLIDPVRRTTWNEPLISVGTPVNGIVVYLRHLDGLHYRFGLNRIGEGATESKVVNLDPTRPHEVVWYATSGEKPMIAIGFDDLIVIELQEQSPATSSRSYFYGVNEVVSGIVVPAFQGTIERVEPLAAFPERLQPEGPAVNRLGAVSLVLALSPGVSGVGQPLVVSGTAGRADFIYVRMVDPDHLVVGEDHWGGGGKESAPIATGAFQAHHWVIRWGAMRPSAEEADHAMMRVLMDGREVFTRELEAYPIRLDRVYVGENPVGGSSAAARIEGNVTDLKVLR